MYLGIDNGVSGSFAVLDDAGNAVDFWKIPTRKDLSYTQKAAWVTRVDVREVVSRLRAPRWFNPTKMTVIMERPMVNPQRFVATASALRAYEATLIALEQLRIAVTGYVDSRKWQRMLLPAGITGNALKPASVSIGCRMFPQYQKEIEKYGDADSLLIATYAFRTLGCTDANLGGFDRFQD